MVSQRSQQVLYPGSAIVLMNREAAHGNRSITLFPTVERVLLTVGATGIGLSLVRMPGKGLVRLSNVPSSPCSDIPTSTKSPAPSPRVSPCCATGSHPDQRGLCGRH